MNIILFDSDARNHLLPLTATRPMGELRVGILTLREKWERLLRGTASYITQEYLQEKYPIRIEDENVIVNAGILPSEQLCHRIKELKPSEALLLNGEKNVSELNKSVKVSQPALSQHLSKLRQEGVLGARREQRQIFYYISNTQVIRLLGTAAEMAAEMGTAKKAGGSR